MYLYKITDSHGVKHEFNTFGDTMKFLDNKINEICFSSLVCAGCPFDDIFVDRDPRYSPIKLCEIASAPYSSICSIKSAHVVVKTLCEKLGFKVSIEK